MQNISTIFDRYFVFLILIYIRGYQNEYFKFKVKASGILNIERESNYDQKLIQKTKELQIDQMAITFKETIMDLNLLEYKFLDAKPSYLNVKFTGNCQVPLLFSLENPVVNAQLFEDYNHTINYTQIGLSYLYYGLEYQENSNNIQDSKIWQQQQSIMFNKDTDFQNLRIFTICLLFDSTQQKVFDNEFFVHVGNDIAFSQNNINWFEIKSLEEEQFLNTIEAEETYFVFVPWIQNYFKIENLSNTNIKINIWYFEDDKELEMERIKYKEDEDEYDAIFLFIQIQNVTKEQQNVNFLLKTSIKKDTFPIYWYFIIVLCCFVGIVFIIFLYFRFKKKQQREKKIQAIKSKLPIDNENIQRDDKFSNKKNNQVEENSIMPQPSQIN